MIGEGRALVRKCLANNEPGRYQIQATIQAVYTDAATFEDTDWTQIVSLYDQLLDIAPDPVAALTQNTVARAAVGACCAGVRRSVKLAHGSRLANKCGVESAGWGRTALRTSSGEAIAGIRPQCAAEPVHATASGLRNDQTTLCQYGDNFLPPEFGRACG